MSNLIQKYNDIRLSVDNNSSEFDSLLAESINNSKLKEGTIIEQGNHDSLLKVKDSYYSKLWRIQTGKQDDLEI